MIHLYQLLFKALLVLRAAAKRHFQRNCVQEVETCFRLIRKTHAAVPAKYLSFHCSEHHTVTPPPYIS